MNAEQISKPDRAARYVALSYGCLLAEALAITFALLFGYLSTIYGSDGIEAVYSTIVGVLFILVFILPLAGVSFGRLGMRISLTESLSKKANRGRQLNEGMFVLILVLVVIIALATIRGCACGDNTFTPISGTLPS